MAYPDLKPVSNSSKSILPSVGNIMNVTTSSLPFGIYANTDYWNQTQVDLFRRGAVEQVSFVYKKLGGDVLDIEIVESQVYAGYEEATLEYSYLINLHQSKNSLSSFLGGSTSSFDSNGQISGSESHAELAYPKWTIGYARRVAEGVSGIAGLNGNDTVYSASFTVTEGRQDYDLQAVLQNSPIYSASVGNNKVLIKRLYYKTLAASWNFYGYFGGLNVVGNLSTYGQYADDSTFEIIPTWQNKLQAMAYEDAVKTRVSDYSYQIRNNNVRIQPTPSTSSPTQFWFEFVIPGNSWEEEVTAGAGVSDNKTGGINNLNSLPFQNIPYDKINSMGKQWIRRYALSLCKEMLGHVRSKFATIPIPGEAVTLNGPALVSEAKTEQKELKEELLKVLDETTYDKLAEKDAAIADSAFKVNTTVPNLIFVG
jgi:hypothetical protein